MAQQIKTGKPLEKVVRLIQETFKDKPNITIYSNYKVENNGGRKREFDIFIISQINDIQVKIAIECKEYSSPVPVEKIEAFNSKCSRIPTINKKVFVSKSGYQADSINAAREFGIDLYNLDNIDKDEILKWFPISQLGLRFGIIKYELVIDTTEEQLGTLNEKKFTEFHFSNTHNVDVIKFINDRVFDSKRELWAITIVEFLKNGGSKSIGKVTQLSLPIGLESAFIIDDKGNQYPLVGIESTINSWFVESPVQIVESQTFSLNNDIRAGHLSIESPSKTEKTDVILTKDKFKVFHTSENGATTELGVIATFDPKTGKLITANPQ